jgi:hypothetical protein
MKIDAETADGFGIALNEAKLLGVEYDPTRNLIATTFSVLTLPDDHSPEPMDPRVQIVFSGVGRVAAALRNAVWNVRDAETIPLEISDLLQVVRSFGGQPVYGWEFVNVDDPEFRHWEKRLSLDYYPPSGSTDNRINLFQESVVPERHLDLWMWFSEIHLRNSHGDVIAMEDFIAGADRWWTAMYSRDHRTSGHGISPLDEIANKAWL